MTSTSQPLGKIVLGAKMSKEFFGDRHMAKLQENLRDDIFTKVAQEYLAETCFSSYARPGLEFKERSLMNIAMLIALNRGPELRIHIRAAIHNGFSEEKVCEMCRHAMIYCGVPAGRDAMAISSDVINELKESGEMPGEPQGSPSVQL